MMIRVRVPLCLWLTIACCAAGAPAQDRPVIEGDAVVRDGRPVIEAPGEALGAPPPWLRPGEKLTYYVLTGGIAGPNTDPEESLGGGTGYMELQVVAVEGGRAMLSVRSLGTADPGGPAMPLTTNGEVVAVGANDYWVDPDQLRLVQEENDEGWTVMRVIYRLDGREYNAIQFVSERGRDERLSRTSRVFDEASGVLLYSSASTPTRRGRQFTQLTLKGRRTLNLPWLDDPPPDWLATIERVTYEGRSTVLVQIPDVPPMAVGMRASVEVTDRGHTYTRGNVNVTRGRAIGSPETGSVSDVSGIGQIGGFWVPPAGLQELRRNQVLDEDPITRFRWTVSSTAGGIVTLTEEGPRHRTDVAYDARTGLMQSVRREERSVATTITELQLSGQE